MMSSCMDVIIVVVVKIVVSEVLAASLLLLLGLEPRCGKMSEVSHAGNRGQKYRSLEVDFRTKIIEFFRGRPRRGRQLYFTFQVLQTLYSKRQKHPFSPSDLQPRRFQAQLEKLQQKIGLNNGNFAPWYGLFRAYRFRLSPETSWVEAITARCKKHQTRKSDARNPAENQAQQCEFCSLIWFVLGL